MKKFLSLWKKNKKNGRVSKIVDIYIISCDVLYFSMEEEFSKIQRNYISYKSGLILTDIRTQIRGRARGVEKKETNLELVDRLAVARVVWRILSKLLPR